MKIISAQQNGDVFDPFEDSGSIAVEVKPSAEEEKLFRTGLMFFKKKDKNYTIVSIGGQILYPNNFQNCRNEQKKIVKISYLIQFFVLNVSLFNTKNCIK